MEVKWTKEALKDLERLSSWQVRVFWFLSASEWAYKGRQLKWFIQRLYRGYGDNDLWSLDSYFLKKIRPPFKHFVKNYKKYSGGCPAFMTYDKKTKKDIPVEEGVKLWTKELEEIEEALDLMWEEYEGDYKFEKKTYTRNLKKIDRGMKKFAKYFGAFWT